MAPGDVSIVVATLGESPLLTRTLWALRQQADDLGAELLLVFNAGADAPPAGARSEWADLAHRVLHEGRAGKSWALNRGVAAARGDVIAFGDDDALPAPGWLAAITAPLRDGPTRLAGCGGRVLPVFPEGGPPPWLRRLLARTRSTFLGPYHDLGAVPCDYAADRFVVPFGANCAYRKALIREPGYHPGLGPSRATGLRGGEDTELALRLMRQGWRLRYCPDAVVYHPVDPARLTWEYVARGYYWQGVERARLCRILGIPVPSPWQLQRRRLRTIVRLGWATLARSRRRPRLRLRLHYLRGQRDELRREAPE